MRIAITKVFTAASILSGGSLAVKEASAQNMRASQPAPVDASDIAPATLPAIVVTAPGGEIDEDEAAILTASDINRIGTPDVLASLARNLPGLSLSDAQNNPWQPNLVYRGFTASPLQGTAQGLATYLDGARFNQSFGDTVDFDLLPAAAIETVTIKSANPVYGLNALGGAVIFATKTGRTAPGLRVSGAGGRYGRAEANVEAGWAGEHASAYIAVSENHDGGWRLFSPSTLYNGFADIGWDAARAGLHIKAIGADTNLTGNGTSPVELLAVSRRAVFTHPDNTRNRYARVSAHPWAALGDTTRIEASVYLQRLRQATLNGDAADIEGCDDDDDAGLLCLETASGDATRLIGADGNAVADTLEGGSYGVLNRSSTRTNTAGLLVQMTDRRAVPAGENVLTIGVSHDRSRTEFRSSTELGQLTDERSVEGLGTIVTQPDGAIAPVSLKARTRYSGVFLADTLPLLRGLKAEIGLRWNEARILLDDRIGTALDGRHRFSRLNPGIELDYAVTDAVSVRAGYAETNRNPTPAELSCADETAPCSLTNFFVADPPLRQVVAKTWEAGLSGNTGLSGWRLQWSLSGYRATNHDDIQFIASAIRGRAYFQNVGATRRQGVEVDLSARRGDWLFHAGYALTDATFRTPLILASPDNPSADGDGQIAVRPGDRLPGIPQHRGVITIDYTGRGFSLGGDMQAQSGQVLVGDEANLQPSTRAFAVFAVRGSVALSGPLTLFASISNLFDKDIATFGAFGETTEVDLVEAPGASDPRSLGPGAPRRWMAGLRATF